MNMFTVLDIVLQGRQAFLAVQLMPPDSGAADATPESESGAHPRSVFGRGPAAASAPDIGPR